MTDEKTPIEQALDVILYAPVGLVFSARELLPKLAEKGRSQLGMAKMIGQFAVQQGQTEAGKVLGQAQKQALSSLEQLAGRPAAPRTNGPSANGAAPKPAPVIDVEVVDAPAVPTPSPSAGVLTSGPEAVTLAITDYDSLSASQVLPRLNGLSADELEAVRSYEAAHRGRKTILNRAAQLQSST
ncbi:MAG TPA: hypothetical protein VMQ81_13890 [Acidimicrobiia bacterium]|nr:hypothetical protein [Acidimicrobiia bacterium]